MFAVPNSGEALFPGGADDTLAKASMNVGWHVEFEEGEYIYMATHPASDAVLHYVEDELYCLLEGRTTERLAEEGAETARELILD